MNHDVVTQKASANMQQRVIQTGYQYERAVVREEVVSGIREAEFGGEYHGQVTGVREFAVANDVEISREVVEEVLHEAAPVVTTFNLPQERDLVMEQREVFTGQPVVQSTTFASQQFIEQPV